MDSHTHGPVDSLTHGVMERRANICFVPGALTKSERVQTRPRAVQMMCGKKESEIHPRLVIFTPDKIRANHPFGFLSFPASSVFYVKLLEDL